MEEEVRGRVDCVVEEVVVMAVVEGCEADERDLGLLAAEGGRGRGGGEVAADGGAAVAAVVTAEARDRRSSDEPGRVGGFGEGIAGR